MCRNTLIGRDHSIHATVDGHVYYTYIQRAKPYTFRQERRPQIRKFVNVLPVDQPMSVLNAYTTEKEREYLALYAKRKTQFEATQAAKPFDPSILYMATQKARRLAVRPHFEDQVNSTRSVMTDPNARFAYEVVEDRA